MLSILLLVAGCFDFCANFSECIMLLACAFRSLARSGLLADWDDDVIILRSPCHRDDIIPVDSWEILPLKHGKKLSNKSTRMTSSQWQGLLVMMSSRSAMKAWS